MIYIIHCDLIEDDKSFNELTDEEVVKLCENDKDGFRHYVFEDIHELAKVWNIDENIDSCYSYMRVID